MAKMKLSKNLMQMKFMQRNKEELESEEDRDGNLFNQNHTYMTKRQRYMFEPSYTFFENMRFGRLSYKGMNVEIEKLMQEKKEHEANRSSGNGKNAKPDDGELDDVEITDEQMARQYVEMRNRKAGASNERKRKRDED